LNTLKSLKLNEVDIEDTEVEIPGCCFSIDYDNLNEEDSYNMLLEIIAEKVEVVNYNEKTNVATLDLSGFVYENFNVLDNIIDIPCHDPQDEYLNIIVAMINGYEGKPYYDAFLEAYKENKFVDSNTENKNEESNEVEI
jgi:hypothetical protein